MPKSQAAVARAYYPGDQLFKEGEYDHVFDVDCGDGVLRKLPFDDGGNIDEAANKFCIKENFSKIHVEQIKKFLSENSSKVARPGTVSKNARVVEESKGELLVSPMSDMQFFEGGNIDLITKKILELGEEK
jgi:PFU (PLAA family ubiquitin binding)